MGNPTLADREEGEKILEAITDELAEIIRQVLKIGTKKDS